MNRPTPSPDGSFHFQVNIQITAADREAALLQLQRLLENANAVNYSIESSEKQSDSAANIQQTSSSNKQTANPPAQPNPLEIRIRQCIESHQLIRLNVNKGRGIQMNIPCRIINFDSGDQLITVYHVDEKQVYSLKLNEIDDFLEG